MNKKQLIGTLMLVVAALLWGTTFVAQDIGAAYLEGFSFLTMRSIVASVVLGAFCVGRDLRNKKADKPLAFQKGGYKTLVLGGMLCGCLLCAASLLQQFGIANNVTSPGKDAFITALYIVFVPVIGLFLGKRAQPHVYLCVIGALVGLWLLCMGGSGLTAGDIQVIACSLVFSLHIIVVDHVAPKVDGVCLSLVQFLTVTLVSGVFMLIFETPTWENILAAIGSILFAGVLSSAVAYTLQILGQKNSPSTLACLVMSLESVFAVIASILFLPDVPSLTGREWGGMALIFAAIILSQIPLRYGKKKEISPETGGENA